MKDIAQEIKRIRKEHNLTQQQFADKIYVSRQAVSKYERNQCMPNVDVINKVKELFGEDLNSIIEDEEIKQILASNSTEINKLKKSKKITHIILLSAASLLIVAIITTLFYYIFTYKAKEPSIIVHEDLQVIQFEEKQRYEIEYGYYQYDGIPSNKTNKVIIYNDYFSYEDLMGQTGNTLNDLYRGVSLRVKTLGSNIFHHSDYSDYYYLKNLSFNVEEVHLSNIEMHTFKIDEEGELSIKYVNDLVGDYYIYYYVDGKDWYEVPEIEFFVNLDNMRYHHGGLYGFVYNFKREDYLLNFESKKHRFSTIKLFIEPVVKFMNKSKDDAFSDIIRSEYVSYNYTDSGYIQYENDDCIIVDKVKKNNIISVTVDIDFSNMYFYSAYKGYDQSLKIYNDKVYAYSFRLSQIGKTYKEYYTYMDYYPYKDTVTTFYLVVDCDLSIERADEKLYIYFSKDNSVLN